MSGLAAVRQMLLDLRATIDRIEDPFARTQIRLASDMLLNALGDPASPLTPALVNDVAFAFNDVRAGAADLSGADAGLVAPFVQSLEREIDAMKEATALPADLIRSMREFQAKLKVRRAAIERQTYVENQSVPLPHPPAELRDEAIPLRERLTAAGFATPALDALIDDPGSLRFSTIGDVVDELDVIAGE